jgi:hypothetical protein
VGKRAINTDKRKGLLPAFSHKRRYEADTGATTARERTDGGHYGVIRQRAVFKLHVKGAGANSAAPYDRTTAVYEGRYHTYGGIEKK